MRIMQLEAVPLRPVVTGALIVFSILTLAPTATAQASTVATSGVYDNAAPAVSLSRGWTSIKSTQATAGTYANLATAGYAQVNFSGTGFSWTARTNPAGGLADVFLDGTRQRRVNLYSAQTRFQQVVFTATGLRAGQHTVRIVRTGIKVAASAGRNVMIDAVQVLDSQAPATPATVTARADRTGARITWSPSPSVDLAGYRVYRTPSGGGIRTLVGTTGATTRTLLDIGLADSTAYSYRVTAVDTSRNVSTPSGSAAVRTAPAVSPTTLRYANCPTATTTVANRSELVAALAAAGPGTVIRLAPGRYAGQFDVSVKATVSAPVWICGPRTAVVDGGGPNRRGGFRISNSAHVVLAGMTVRDSIKGISVWHSTAVTVADTRVENIGDEAIHLLDFTTDTTVVANSIDGTGLVDPEYGEGVYIGTADNNWCAYSQCLPDRSDRNLVVGNNIRRTTAKPIEAKVATSGGVISGNTIDGQGMRPTSSALIYVKGNSYVVSHNTGRNSSIDGVLVVQRNAGWGRDNLVFGNRFSGSIPGYGVRMDAADLGNIVGCGVVTGANSIAATSRACQP